MNEETLFAAVLELASPAERTAFLERECAGRPEVRARLDALLKSHDEAVSFLKHPAPEFAPTVIPEKPANDAIGSRIGPYKLLQEIGQGGMGTVFMAEQTAPVKRMVAIKVIKPGMDTAQVVARFEAERQALALMDHPNIAKVLDAGTTEAGRPYFVMELVKGVTITKYCDEHQLTPRERMELFVPVCQAIQHAHQKGIIHRDLKPSNVMIASYDGRPVPKVIDFGVAKAMGQQLTERTMFTGFGGIVGTLEYMSPEQAEFNALDVDTRSDIYSLGVLLYELLTGSTPLTKLQINKTAITELLRLIREEEPPRPSTRLSESRDSLASLSVQRKLDPAKLTKEVSGELDWIVMKALEKDRTRRYETATGMARDLERYLRDEAVEACPPSLRYRLQKFTRRHRRNVAVFALVAVLLLIIVVNHIGSYFRLQWSQTRIAAEAERAKQAEALAVDRLATTDQQRRRAEQAEQEAHSERDKALLAEKQTRTERDRAVAAERDAVKQRELEAQTREQVTDAFARSQFDQANAVRLAGLSGRRWIALDLLKQAEALRSREKSKPVADAASVGGSDAGSVRHVALPSQTELRTEAVAALMLNDGRVTKHRSGFTHSVSPDGRFAASFSADPKTFGLSVVDLQAGEVVRHWQGKEAEPMSGLLMALGPRAEQLAIVSLSQRQIKVWELKEKKLLRTLTKPSPPADNAAGDNNDNKPATTLPDGPFRQLAFSPDGRCLAGVLTGKPGEVIIALWKEDGPLEGQALATVRGIPLASAVFSPDSRFLAFASDVKKTTVWNIAENRIERNIELPIFTDGALGFDPRGERLAIHGGENKRGSAPSSRLLLWDIAQNREVSRLDTGAMVSTTPVSFAPNGRRVAVSGSNRTIAVLDVPMPGQKTAPLVRVNHGLLPQMIAWSASGQLLSGGLGGLKQWEFASVEMVSLLRLDTDKPAYDIGRLAFSPDGKTLAAEAWPGPHFALFDPTSGQRIRSWDTSLDVGNVAMRFSPDGQQLFRFGQRGLRIWNVSTGEEQKRSADQPAIETVTSVGVRPDGGLLVADVLLRGQFNIWDLALGKAIWQSPQRKLGATALVSADGRFAVAYQAFAVGRAERPIQVWNLEQNQERFVIPSPPADSFQTMVEISPDSRWIAALHFGGDIAKAFPRGTPDGRYVQEALAGKTEIFSGPAGAVFGQGFTSIIHPDQEWFGEVWNVETGNRHCQLYGPVNIENYALSPNGRYLAVGMRGGIIRVWDIPAGKELFDWQQPRVSTSLPPVPRQIAFMADSTTLAIPDESSPTLYLLNLARLNQQLAEVSLGW